MRNRWLPLAIAMGGAALSAEAQVIDQNAPTNNSVMAAFYQCCLAQSFQQSNSNISGAGIFLTGAPGFEGSGTISISVWDKLPNQSGAHSLATGSVFGTSGNWADAFWSALSVTPNTTYYLVFESPNDGLAIAGDIYNGYSRGDVYANDGYNEFPDFDYTFRTYADIDGSAVPEPASVALLGTGLVGVFAVARRKISRA